MTDRLLAEYLSSELSNCFGYSIDVDVNRIYEGLQLLIGPTITSPETGFTNEIIIGFGYVKAELQIHNFAGQLVSFMKNAGVEQKRLFSRYADELTKIGAQLLFKLDDNEVDYTNIREWPSDWSDIIFSFEVPDFHVDINESTQPATYQLARNFLGCVLSLCQSEIDRGDIGNVEGNEKYRIVKQYERSRLNRALCIEKFGYDCQACGMNFRERYGDLGRDYIHVHHVVPLSEMGEAYVLDPTKDLVPLCPNCHAMAHQHDPVLLPHELKNILNKRDY